MKILLIGNYRNSRQHSMQLYAELIKKGLIEAGHWVRLVRPAPFFGNLWPRADGFGKWLGYIDRFILFALRLRQIIRWADIVHICDQANAVYIPHMKDKAHVITCHDMIAIDSALSKTSETKVSLTGRIYQRWILRNICKAQRIVCDSEHTMDELVRLSNLPMDPISVVPITLNYPYHPMDTGEARIWLRRMGIDTKTRFLIHVGGNQWYKNREGVLRIFSRLRKIPGFRQYRLVMAGSPLSPQLKQLVGELNIAAHTSALVDVSCEDLRALYTAAQGLLFPSLQEGFGWPIIEAQACGCPVFTSNHPPMNHVGGDAAVYFDPEDEQAAALIIADKLADRTFLKAAGLRNTLRFSKELMIKRYIASYQIAIQERTKFAVRPPSLQKPLG